MRPVSNRIRRQLGAFDNSPAIASAVDAVMRQAARRQRRRRERPDINLGSAGQQTPPIRVLPRFGGAERQGSPLMTANKSHPPSRRDVVNGGGASLAIVASSPAVAKTSHDNKESPALQDPKDKYPNPPFERQSQPWPGLAGRMTPRPDHGESSYRGSGRLAGRKALVTGGDSGMGRAAAIAFAREGADVAINHLPEEEEDAREVIDLIRKEGRTGLSIAGDLRDEAF